MGTEGAVEVELLFSPAILSIMWQLMVGRISKADEPLINVLSENINKFVLSSAFAAGLVTAFPVLRHIFPRWTGYNVQMAFFTVSHEIAEVSNISKSFSCKELFKDINLLCTVKIG